MKSGTTKTDLTDPTGIWLTSRRTRKVSHYTMGLFIMWVVAPGAVVLDLLVEDWPGMLLRKPFLEPESVESRDWDALACNDRIRHGESNKRRPRKLWVW